MLNVDGRKQFAEQEIVPPVLKYVICFTSDKAENRVIKLDMDTGIS